MLRDVMVKCGRVICDLFSSSTAGQRMNIQCTNTVYNTVYRPIQYTLVAWRVVSTYAQFNRWQLSRVCRRRRAAMCTLSISAYRLRIDSESDSYSTLRSSPPPPSPSPPDIEDEEEDEEDEEEEAGVCVYHSLSCS